jgi:hypothetical protein
MLQPSATAAAAPRVQLLAASSGNHANDSLQQAQLEQLHQQRVETGEAHVFKRLQDLRLCCFRLQL